MCFTSLLITCIGLDSYAGLMRQKILMLGMKILMPIKIFIFSIIEIYSSIVPISDSLYTKKNFQINVFIFHHEVLSFCILNFKQFHINRLKKNCLK